MARLAATASLAILLFSLLALAHCRVLESELAIEAVASPDGASAVTSPDEQGHLPKPEEAGPNDVVVVPTRGVAAREVFLRLPSHRRHSHPCRHRNPWWARHHGFILQDAYGRFHRHGGRFPHLVVDNRAHLAIDVPAELPHVEEPKDAEEEVKAVAEPDPDHSHPDTDGEIEEEAKKPFHGEEEEDDETVKAWKREMLRRFLHGRRFHRRHHQEDEDEDEHEHEQDEEGAAGAMTRFHHHDEDEEETTRKRFRHDSDVDEDDEAEETARWWRKAITRRRFHHRHHGRRFHRRHHAEVADEQHEEEESGVMKWFKDLMNRF